MEGGWLPTNWWSCCQASLAFTVALLIHRNSSISPNNCFRHPDTVTSTAMNTLNRQLSEPKKYFCTLFSIAGPTRAEERPTHKCTVPYHAVSYRTHSSSRTVRFWNTVSGRSVRPFSERDLSLWRRERNERSGNEMPTGNHFLLPCGTCESTRKKLPSVAIYSSQVLPSALEKYTSCPYSKCIQLRNRMNSTRWRVEREESSF